MDNPKNIIINNIKVLNYEINNIDNMIRLKTNILSEEILFFKNILNETTDNYMIILKNLN